MEPVLTSASFAINEMTSRLKIFLELRRKTAISLFDIFNIIVMWSFMVKKLFFTRSYLRHVI